MCPGALACCSLSQSPGGGSGLLGHFVPLNGLRHANQRMFQETE